MRILPTLCLPLALLVIAGCESDRPAPKVESAHDERNAQEDDRAATEADIRSLAQGKDPADIAATKQYDDAVAHLIRRGSGIETTLIDNLRRSADWAVRLGIIEVLMATGTRASVDHLIVCLEDDEPLVALRANTTLQEMTQHAEIPVAGSAGANGLPPVPRPPTGDLAMDAELRQWTLWHREHKAALRQAWAAWWSASKDKITIK